MAPWCELVSSFATQSNASSFSKLLYPHAPAKADDTPIHTARNRARSFICMTDLVREPLPTRECIAGRHRMQNGGRLFLGFPLRHEDFIASIETACANDDQLSISTVDDGV